MGWLGQGWGVHHWPCRACPPTGQPPAHFSHFLGLGRQLPPRPDYDYDYYYYYYNDNKSKNPYCRFVIEPKLKKLKLDH
jgi:hypothetical protein